MREGGEKKQVSELLRRLGDVVRTIVPFPMKRDIRMNDEINNFFATRSLSEWRSWKITGNLQSVFLRWVNLQSYHVNLNKQHCPEKPDLRELTPPRTFLPLFLRLASPLLWISIALDRDTSSPSFFSFFSIFLP